MCENWLRVRMHYWQSLQSICAFLCCRIFPGISHRKRYIWDFSTPLSGRDMSTLSLSPITPPSSQKFFNKSPKYPASKGSMLVDSYTLRYRHLCRTNWTSIVSFWSALRSGQSACLTTKLESNLKWLVSMPSWDKSAISFSLRSCWWKESSYNSTNI